MPEIIIEVKPETAQFLRGWVNYKNMVDNRSDLFRNNVGGLMDEIIAEMRDNMRNEWKDALGIAEESECKR